MPSPWHPEHFFNGLLMVTRDYTIRLDEVFQGPLDLLLHLVREQEVEIHEVEIHRVIDGYFDYLAQLEELDIEVAGDFLVMAATLMAIKSRSLLPRDEVELDDDLDPEDELIQRLMEYRRFKGAAEDLETLRVRRSLEHERGYRAEVKDHEPERTLELGQMTAWDLLSTFSRLLRETLANSPMQVRGDRRPLRWYVSELGKAIRESRSLSLVDLLGAIDGPPTRPGMIGAFCALLELMRLGIVTAHQEHESGEIGVRLVEGEGGNDLDDLIRSAHFLDEEEPEGLERPQAESEAESEAQTEPQSEDDAAVEAASQAEETAVEAPRDALGNVMGEVTGEVPTQPAPEDGAQG